MFHTCDVIFDAEKFCKIYKELNKANRPIIHFAVNLWNGNKASRNEVHRDSATAHPILRGLRCPAREAASPH